MSAPFFECEHAAQVLSELRRLAGAAQTRLRTETVLRKLEARLGLPRVGVQEAVRELHRMQLLHYAADGRGLPASAYITVVHEELTPPAWETQWKRALQGTGFAASQVLELSALATQLSDLPEEDMEHLADGLRRLHDSDEAAYRDAGFNVSARFLMGGSKVLSWLSRRMLKALALPERLHNTSPKYVLCAGPASPRATLLIENPRAFENAIRSGLADKVALICTFGFGLAYLGQEWLHRQETPELDRPILIVRQGEPPSLSRLLGCDDVFLWADLDLAAIGIYRALKGGLPQLRWSRIYEAMLPMLQDPRASHPYAGIFEKAGQIAQSADMGVRLSLDKETASLWDACMKRAVDQEAINDVAIRTFGESAYALSSLG